MTAYLDASALVKRYIVEHGSRPPLVFIENWIEELKRLAPIN